MFVTLPSVSSVQNPPKNPSISWHFTHAGNCAEALELAVRLEALKAAEVRADSS